MDAGRRGRSNRRSRRQHQSSSSTESVPNLAAHFAALTNAVLRRIPDSDTIDDMYDDYMARAKRTLVKELKETYRELYDFYNDSSLHMPSWLSKTPPVKTFYLDDWRGIDVRLESRHSQMRQDLFAFAEELGFVCQQVNFISMSSSCISVTVRLDVAKIPTAESREQVNNRLLTLDDTITSFDGLRNPYV